MLEEARAYRITPPGFTPEQRARFDHDGYLRIRNVLSGAAAPAARLLPGRRATQSKTAQYFVQVLGGSSCCFYSC